MEGEQKQEHKITTDAREKHTFPSHRILLLASGGTPAPLRMLQNDFVKLYPHHKQEIKYNGNRDPEGVSELADLRRCDTIVYAEGRHHRDLFMWFCVAETGPSIKCQVHEIDLLSDPRLQGNCARFSRPILSFDSSFDGAKHLRITKELLKRTFSVPRPDKRAKPFIDHILSFTHHNGFIFVRNYATHWPGTKTSITGAIRAGDLELVEIGPRFTLQLISILGKCLGGPTLWKNDKYVSPSMTKERRLAMKAGKTRERVMKKDKEEEMAEFEKPLANPIDSIL